MTRDEIIAMAKEAGCVSATFWPDGFTGLMGVFERFAALVAEADRAARIAAQTEAAELKERLARSGVEQRRAVREAVLAESEACAQVSEAEHVGADVCDDCDNELDETYNRALRDGATAIRERGAA